MAEADRNRIAVETNWVVSPFEDDSYTRRSGPLQVTFLSTRHILAVERAQDLED